MERYGVTAASFSTSAVDGGKLFCIMFYHFLML